MFIRTPSAVSLQSANSFTVLRSQDSWVILRTCGLLYDRPALSDENLLSSFLFLSRPPRKFAVHSRVRPYQGDTKLRRDPLQTDQTARLASRGPGSASNKV